MHVPAGVVTADTLVRDDESDLAGHRWSVDSLAGSLVELIYTPAPAVLSAATMLVRDAQQQGTPCLWITTGKSMVYPPDLERCGVDISRLMVVRVPDLSAATRSTEYLGRSGGVGLILTDISDDGRDDRGARGTRDTGDTCGIGEEGIKDLSWKIDPRFAGRIVRIARSHRIAVVCIAREGVLGSLVNVRAEARRERTGDGLFRTDIRIIKDRRFGTGSVFSSTHHDSHGVR